MAPTGPSLRTLGAVTVDRLAAAKAAGERIACLTAYDATFARQLDAAGVDVVLVGDSLGNVIQGHATTLPVTLEAMVYHTRAVSQGTQRALVVADLPFLSYTTPEAGVTAAGRLLAEGGAAMVKLEGGAEVATAVTGLSRWGIPVCAHLGLTPQSIHKLGRYRVQARDEATAEQLLRDARLLQDSGADLLVLECVPRALAERVTSRLRIPVIGIGAGPECDGQVLVLYDMLGLTPPEQRPRFVADFLADSGTIPGALAAYVEAVRTGRFPGAEHCLA
jgi:3-methyl-2-oxobutanoate hydroxymethyltransferase